MSESLGLSIGMTNLVAERAGQPPVSRRAVLTIFDNRPPEVGVPTENPNLDTPGTVLSGFVERVGDPVPLVAADGSAHSGEQLLAEALDALVRTSGDTAPSQITITYPAHWSAAAVGALRGALRGKPALSPAGVTATLVPDSAATLTALSNDPGLPTSGVVALCDFGGTGTSITLVDAGARFAPIGETVRYAEFSGAQIDQALLSQVMTAAADAGDADPASTAAVGSLGRLRDACRQAKERLSAETVTSVPVDLVGFASDIRVTRGELENLIAPALAGFLDVVGDALERNRIPAAQLAAVATAGGGAAIPVITQQLSEELRVPVVTTATPAWTAASGATLLAARGPSSDDATGMATVATDLEATGLAPAVTDFDAPTGLAPAAAAGPPSGAIGALAWSQDDSPSSEPVPYAGEDYVVPSYESGVTGARPQVEYAAAPDDLYAEPAPLAWYRRPPIIFGAAAAVALLAVGGLAYTLTSSTSGTTETTTSGSVTETVNPTSAEQPTEAPPATTVTITDSNGNTSTSVVPPPPVTTTTTTAPTTTTTTTTTSPTTTTTTPTTTTTTTTTRTTTTTPTTTSQVITTTSPPPPPPTSSILTGVTPPPVEPDEPIIDPVTPDDPA